jgi:hypothetical protein
MARHAVSTIRIYLEVAASPSTVPIVLNGTWEMRRIKGATAEEILSDRAGHTLIFR